MSDTEIKTLGMMPALPIPIYSSVRIGSMRSRDGDMFTIYAGLELDQVAQLRAYSLDENDEEIQKNTSDRQRFGEGSYEKWYAKVRVPFALVHDSTGTLAAITWFGPKPLGRKSLKHLSAEERTQDERSLDAGDWHTIVYRAYGSYRGKGLMKAFVKFTMDAYRTVHPGSKIWAGIYAENPASRGLVEKLGFKMRADLSDAVTHETVMAWEEN
jgi:RimJ/RimL family protein N-acetyltransferase